MMTPSLILRLFGYQAHHSRLESEKWRFHPPMGEVKAVGVSLSIIVEFTEAVRGQG